MADDTELLAVDLFPESPLREVVSPVNGVITKITDTRMEIYISPSDDHTIFSPMRGRITAMRRFQGDWIRDVFKAHVHKIARLTIEIDGAIEFFLEVGKPKYITDRIRVTVKEGDEIDKGQAIGEILLGSLAEVHLLKGGSFVRDLKPEMRLEGGSSVIATL